MKSHYKRIGDYVTQIKLKNTDGSISSLKGININKHFMRSVANVNGTDLSKYRVVKKNQFAFNPMHVGRDEVLPISMLEDDEPIIVSPAYVVFEVKDEEELLPAYLMMWCRRSDFDRNAWFMTDNSVRGGFSWADFCDMKLPVPSIEKQREIVREYNVVNDRIALNEQLTQKLEDTAQAIYKQWFVDFEFPISREYAESIGKPELEGKPYKSSGGEMEFNEYLETDIPQAWSAEKLGDVCQVLDSRRKPLSGEQRLKMQGEYPYYGAMSIVDYVNDYLFDGTYVLFSEDGANVVDEQGYPALQYVWGKFWVNNHAHILQGSENLTNEYLYLALKKTKFGHLVTGAAQPKINQKNMVGVYLCYPSSSVLKAFKPVTSAIFNKIKVTYELTNVLKKLKENLLCKVS
ncbi:restriction endonuclease subunit S [Vibrio parahaemolyticus]|uniref:Restriction endonuclease subunit S n=2 Tax=Vibrio parahaemolyticus TaxID=670 RepID=A0A7Y0SP60_VIBPH|nr:restriction endonuclease subunit S [Vibrio parahaemolyticus]MDF4510997.1 restriction endonuclease subunit S [Vibrio parahaemolyticus]MDF4557785.1 restriction endonuclease subunit S [Vibrio parahaemolyticus]MDF4694984.1 restriction endonuclease subunit S [Vibrio parahaemolyticus]MDF5017727.1 restriction endonuclease subunit S [Vibrio parahaemolyticus]MDF5097164.1 restriction endonuclease subunit S [Vibrio parahaemolyticus]